MITIIKFVDPDILIVLKKVQCGFRSNHIDCQPDNEIEYHKPPEKMNLKVSSHDA